MSDLAIDHLVDSGDDFGDPDKFIHIYSLDGDVLCGSASREIHKCWDTDRLWPCVKDFDNGHCPGCRKPLCPFCEILFRLGEK